MRHAWRGVEWHYQAMKSSEHGLEHRAIADRAKAQADLLLDLNDADRAKAEAKAKPKANMIKAALTKKAS